MTTRLLLILGFLSAAFPAAVLSVEKAGVEKGAAGYLKLGMGARAAGMGNAFVAVADDATALYWNPAGLALVASRLETDLGSVTMGDERSFHTAALAMRFQRDIGGEEGTGSFEADDRRIFRKAHDQRVYGVGFGALSFGVTEIGGRGEFGDELADLSDRETAYTAGVGVKAFEDLMVGLSADYMTQSLAGSKATGLGFGLGALWRSPEEAWTVGFSGRGLGAGLTWSVHDPVVDQNLKYTEAVGMTGSLGLCRRSPSGKWAVSVEGRYQSDQDIQGHAGLEWVLFRTLSLRAGINAYDPTFGAGLKVPFGGGAGLSMQYAYQNDMEGFQDHHWASVILQF